MKQTIARKADISIITDLIHDRFFDLGKVEFDGPKEVITIPFEEEKKELSVTLKNYILFRKVAIPLVRHYLRIYNVKNVIINDTEKIGSYDFNELVINGSKLAIKTGIPLEFEAEISDLQIEIEQTEEIIGHEEKWRVF